MGFGDGDSGDVKWGQSYRDKGRREKGVGRLWEGRGGGGQTNEYQRDLVGTPTQTLGQHFRHRRAAVKQTEHDKDTQNVS